MTLSNAFSRSINDAKTDFWARTEVFIRLCNENMWSVHDLFLLKPFCSSARKFISSRYLLSLLLSIPEYTFVTQLKRLMPR